MLNDYKFGICKVAVATVYETVQDTSAIVTQLLFGEIFYIEDTFEGWLKIRMAFDDYTGWVNAVQVNTIDEDAFGKIVNTPGKYYLNSLVATAKSDRLSIPILFGSSLNFFENNAFFLGDEKFILEGGDDYVSNRQTPERIGFFAVKYINAPYLWGGRSPFGIDCSGLAQNVFRFCGYNLPRDVSQQIHLGESINLFEESERNDLMFFSREENSPIVHVGIYLGDGKIIHASGMVRIDMIDHLGIYNKDLKKYTHLLKQIKRIV